MLTQIIQDVPTLEALRDDWQALATAVPNSIGFFGGWDFAWHYINTIQPDKWFVVTLRDPDSKRLVAETFKGHPL
jgi:hypothetical protein